MKCGMVQTETGWDCKRCGVSWVLPHAKPDCYRLIEWLSQALLPFALYAIQMEKQWGKRSDVFYGIKRPGAHQMTYGDFRRAANVMRLTGKVESGCSPSNATSLAGSSIPDGPRERLNAIAQPASTSRSALQPNEWSSTNMMASKLSDLTELLGSDSANASDGTGHKGHGPDLSVGSPLGKISLLEIAKEQRLQIAIIASEFGWRCGEQGFNLQMTLAKVMEVMGPPDDA